MAAALTIPSLKNDRSLLCPFALIFDSIRTFRRDKRGWRYALTRFAWTEKERERERETSKFRRSVVADDARRSVNRGRAKLVTNRIVRSKWRSPYPFYRPSSDGTRFTATRGNMYPTHHPLCGTIIQICDRQTTNIITPSPSPMFSFPFTLFQRSSRESSRHDSTTILSRDEEKFFDSSPIVGRFFDETKKFLDISVSIYYISWYKLLFRSSQYIITSFVLILFYQVSRESSRHDSTMIYPFPSILMREFLPCPRFFDDSSQILGWFLDDSWTIFGWFLDDFSIILRRSFNDFFDDSWMILCRFFNDSWMILWRFFNDSWMILWRFFDNSWTFLRQFFEDSSMILRWFFDDSSPILGWFLDDPLTIFWWFLDDSLPIFWRFLDDSLPIFWRFLDDS